MRIAVTTSATINFLRKPAPADLIGKARLIKLGRRLAVGEVALYSDGESEMVAHWTGTYSTSRAATTPRSGGWPIVARKRADECGIMIPHR